MDFTTSTEITSGSPLIPAVAPVSEHQEIAHSLRFTGIGSEYFRVWIVNILLSIVTIGWYTPWARLRTANYFFGHTLVAESPLEFTGNPIRMLKGFAVLFSFTIAYHATGHYQYFVLQGILGILALLLMPLIVLGAIRFRLHNTRWRGLRLQLTSGWRGVAMALWPLYACVLIFAGGATYTATSIPSLQNDNQSLGLAIVLISALLVTMVFGYLAMVRIDFNLRSILAKNTALGHLRSNWNVSYGQVMKIWLKTTGIYLVALVASLVLSIFFLVMTTEDSKRMLVGFVPVVLFSISAYAALSYYQARIFQTTWNSLHASPVVRFSCDLRCREFVWLRLQNLFYTIISIGMYRPIARVKEYKAKLESVTLHVRGDLGQLSGSLKSSQPNGVGDALADALGMDLIT